MLCKLTNSITGTIGIVLADEAKSVIGVDIVQQAVDDAAVNSTINSKWQDEMQCAVACLGNGTVNSWD